MITHHVSSYYKLTAIEDTTNELFFVTTIAFFKNSILTVQASSFQSHQHIFYWGIIYVQRITRCLKTIRSAGRNDNTILIIIMFCSSGNSPFIIDSIF